MATKGSLGGTLSRLYFTRNNKCAALITITMDFKCDRHIGKTSSLHTCLIGSLYKGFYVIMTLKCSFVGSSPHRSIYVPAEVSYLVEQLPHSDLLRLSLSTGRFVLSARQVF